VKILTIVAAVAAAMMLTSPSRAAELPLPKDGWASWPVEAVEGAEAWCCWESWEDSAAPKKACNLDEPDGGIGARQHAATDAMRVYAKFANGKLQRLRTLAPSCPVETKKPIQKLDGVTTDDSARWLSGLTKQDDEAGEAVLASLAVHRGNVAFDALATLAAGDSNHETRKHAIFWLALMRGQAGADVATRAMFNDPDTDIRRHAAFAITQSKSTHVGPDLVKLGNTDTNAEVRSQAWFWLAHTNYTNAEQAITEAMKKDPSDHVRDQAVFALSQLPDGRGTRALIAIAENRSLPREQRKRAVFWLAQSKSPEAQAYLDRVLTASSR